MAKHGPTASLSPPAEQRILAAARQEFIDKGLSGARLQAIASRAGVNKALIHYYYRSKQNLYEAAIAEVLGRVWGAVRENLRELEEQAPAEALIRTVVATYINVLRAEPGFLRLFLRELADGGGSFPRIAEELIGTFGEITTRIFGTLGREMESGRIRSIDPVHAVINIMAMCTGSFILQPLIRSMHGRVLRGAIDFDERFYEARIEAVTEMALRGLMTEGARG
jgi:AcrR family transcriptional regulator